MEKVSGRMVCVCIHGRKWKTKVHMAKSGTNPKTLQYIMGHSDIGITLNTYTHVGYEDVQKEMIRVCGS